MAPLFIPLYISEANFIAFNILKYPIASSIWKSIR